MYVGFADRTLFLGDCRYLMLDPRRPTYILTMILMNGRMYLLTPEMAEYGKSGINKDIRPMSYLYSEKDLQGLVEIVAKLAFVYIMQDEAQIDEFDEAQEIKATQASTVSDAIGKYSSFVCAFNKNFSISNFDMIYDLSYRYYDTMSDRFREEFSNMEGQWKNGFEGAALIR